MPHEHQAETIEATRRAGGACRARLRGAVLRDASIEGLEEQDTSFGQHGRVDLELEVRPVDGPPYEAKARWAVKTPAIPQVVIEAELEVCMDADDRTLTHPATSWARRGVRLRSRIGSPCVAASSPVHTEARGAVGLQRRLASLL